MSQQQRKSWPLPTHDEAKWTQLKRTLEIALEHPPQDSASIEALIVSCARDAGNSPPPPPFSSVREVAATDLASLTRAFSNAVSWAFRTDTLFPKTGDRCGTLPVLSHALARACSETGGGGGGGGPDAHATLRLSRGQVACLNAHVLLGSCAGSVSQPKRSPGFLTLYGSRGAYRDAAERIRCMLAYFVAIGGPSATSGGDGDLGGGGEDGIVFEAHGVGSLAAAGHFERTWRQEESRGAPRSRRVVRPAEVSSDVRIEDAPRCAAHVDFANRDPHIGCVIPSATQEEVLFSIRPELFPLMLVGARMRDDEAIVARGARRFCEYSGYLATFKFAGACDPRGREPGGPPAIVVIDAVVAMSCNQFGRDIVLRDLEKAVAGFAAASIGAGQDAWISTGLWGCGAFGGDPALKCAQQLVAAASAGVNLRFSAFRNDNLADMANRIGAALDGLDPGRAVELLLMAAADSSRDFESNLIDLARQR